jgi:hypothetical protein
MDQALLMLAGTAFLAAGGGMLIVERRAVGARGALLKGRRTQELYWMTYLSSFVLAACFLLKAITG